jgi:hypothetical protein
LERYLGQYNVSIAYVDTRKLLDFCDEEFEKISDE